MDRMERVRDIVWHKWLGRPYRLACPVDSGDVAGQSVVLLHGIGREATVWQHLIEQLQGKPYRAVAFDLLGFGQSPKPDWLQYDVDDHVRSIIASLKQRKVQLPCILVGHSMGALIAVRLARLYPEFVKHVILYEMPLYSGLPDTRRYRLRLRAYFKLYKQVIAYKPQFDSAPTVDKQRQLRRITQHIGERMLGYKMSPAVWRSFIRSLEHVIIEQQTGDDIKKVKAPIDVIYGSRDRLVIRGKTKSLFGEDVTNISDHTIREKHRISIKASHFIAQRIDALEADA